MGITDSSVTGTPSASTGVVTPDKTASATEGDSVEPRSVWGRLLDGLVDVVTLNFGRGPEASEGGKDNIVQPGADAALAVATETPEQKFLREHPDAKEVKDILATKDGGKVFLYNGKVVDVNEEELTTVKIDGEMVSVGYLKKVGGDNWATDIDKTKNNLQIINIIEKSIKKHNDEYGTHYVYNPETNKVTAKFGRNTYAAEYDAKTTIGSTLTLQGKEGASLPISRDIVELYGDDISRYFTTRGKWFKTETLEIVKKGGEYYIGEGENARRVFVSSDGNTFTIMDSSGNPTQTFQDVNSIRDAVVGDVTRTWKGEEDDAKSFTYSIGGREINVKVEDVNKIYAADLMGWTYVKIPGTDDVFYPSITVDGKTYRGIRFDQKTGTGWTEDFRPVIVKGEDNILYNVKYDKMGNIIIDKDTPDAIKKSKAISQYLSGKALMSGFKAARTGRLLSNIFGWDESGWAQEMNEFFESSTFGRVISGKWEQSVCSYYVDTASEGVTMILTEDGRPVAGVYVNGKRTKIAGFNETKNKKQTTYLYKLEWMIMNPEQDFQHFYEDNKYNIKLSGKKTVNVYKKSQDIKVGETVQKTGSSALITYSKNNYDQICVVFEKDYKVASGERIRTLCNSITEYKGKATHYASPEQEAKEEVEMNEI